MRVKWRDVRLTETEAAARLNDSAAPSFAAPGSLDAEDEDNDEGPGGDDPIRENGKRRVRGALWHGKRVSR